MSGGNAVANRDNQTNQTHKKRKPRYKQSEIIAALKNTGGMVYLAAKQIGCTADTIYTRAKTEPVIQATIDAERGEMVDIAEAGLKKQVLEGNVTAMIWVTKTLGKNRGYVERSEISGPEGAPIQVQSFNFHAAAASIAPAAIEAGPEPHRLTSGEGQSYLLRQTVGQDADGG